MNLEPITSSATWGDIAFAGLALLAIGGLALLILHWDKRKRK